MSALQQEFWGALDSPSKTGSIRIRETPFGFVFHEKTQPFGMDAIAEGVLKASALLIMVAAVLPWLIPLSQIGTGIGGRASITAMAMIVGYALFRYANRGFAQEFQVDTIKREIRIATRNTNGISLVRQTIPMRQIKSSFIRRPANRKGKSKLNLRIEGRTDPLQLIAADEQALIPVLERLMQIARRRAPGPKRIAA